MKKGTLLLSLIVLSAVAGGGFAYGWTSINRLFSQPANPSVTAAVPSDQIETVQSLDHQIDDPEVSPEPVGPSAGNNVEPAPAASLPGASPEPTATSIDQQLASSISESGEDITLTLDEAQLNQLVTQAIADQEQAAQLLANAHSLKTVLKRDRIETGAVMNLSEIPLEQLPPEVQTGLTQLNNVAPMLANRDIYIGLVAKPQIQDGQITLDQNLSFQFGQFTLPLADVASQMGLSTQDIERQLNAAIAQRGIAVNTLEILDDQMVVTGTRF